MDMLPLVSSAPAATTGPVSEKAGGCGCGGCGCGGGGAAEATDRVEVLVNDLDA